MASKHLLLLPIALALAGGMANVQAQVTFKSPEAISVESHIQSQMASLGRPGLTGEQLKSELLIQSEQRLVKVFQEHPPADQYVAAAFRNVIGKPLEEQVARLTKLREKLRYDTKKSSDKNPKYDAICKHIYLAEWDIATWNQAEVLERLSRLEATYSLYQSQHRLEDWTSFGEQLDHLRDYQPTADFSESLARGFVYPNVMLSAPVAPLQSVSSRSITRPINETMNKDKIQLRATGSATVNYDAHFTEVNGVGNVKVDVAGVANNSLQVTRKRISLQAGLNTHVNGSLYLPMTDRPKETACLNIDNSLRVFCADFQTRIPVLNRLADTLILRIAQKKTPDIEQLSEKEMEKFMRSAISKGVLQGIEKAHEMMAKYAEKNLVENGLRVAYIGTQVEQAANIKLYMDTNYGAPRLSSYAFNQSALNDTLVIRMSEGLFTQFSDSMRGLKMRETDVRELCFEPLGLVPEFEAPLVATVPYSLYLANSTPFVIDMHSGLVKMTFNCDAFDLGEEVFQGKFAISAQYRAEYPDNNLRLVRIGPAVIEHSQSTETEKLQRVADRFFPPAGSSSEVRLLDQLTEGTGVNIERFEIQDGWLAIYVHYDANALLEKVTR